VTVKRDRAEQALVDEVIEVVVPPIEIVSARVEIALGNDAKRAHRREHPAVVAVQFINVIAVNDQLSFDSARQVKIVEKRIARILAAVT
jgi:hypothetical protein